MTPQIYIVAQTHTQHQIYQFLDDAGAPGWGTDAMTDAETLTEFGARLCYMSFDDKLNPNLTARPAKSNEAYIQGSIIGHRHGSVLEHATVSILLRNVSRIVTHELVRHRAGTAFSQESGRYVRVQELELWQPECIASNPEAQAVFKRAEQQALENYRELERIFDINNQPFARKKELTSAMRRILPEGRPTNILVTANHRAWRNIIEQRTAEGAEAEIREVFIAVAERLRVNFPAIYADWNGKAFGVSKV
jgi:thymidylate synthase (FAD)